jgi:hypothetical protein
MTDEARALMRQSKAALLAALAQAASHSCDPPTGIIKATGNANATTPWPLAI